MTTPVTYKKKKKGMSLQARRKLAAASIYFGTPQRGLSRTLKAGMPGKFFGHE